MAIRLADYIMDFLARKGVEQAFVVTGGFAMHLDDALAEAKSIKSVCCHHEQAASYAAEAYGHASGKPALLLVTAVPGSINALSGVFGAYTDSIPLIVISGQNKRELLRSTYGFREMRMIGDQEADIISMARSVTKYARTVHHPDRIAFELGKAWHMAVSDRPGPVWLEIPLDVQAVSIEPGAIPDFRPSLKPAAHVSDMAKEILDRFQAASSPLLVLGPDIAATDRPGVRKLIDRLGVPVVGAGAEDVVLNDHPLFAGRMGILGTRAGNIAIQNADVILFIGVRPYLGFVTFDWKNTGKNAWKIFVDEDPREFEKPCSIADEPIECRSDEIIHALNREMEKHPLTRHLQWCNWCSERIRQLPCVLDRMRFVDSCGRINPYWFIEEFSSLWKDDDVIIAGNASSSIIPLQAAFFRKNQRFFSNHGNGAMGFALPAAIGAAFSVSPQRVVCLEGDGSVMMNLQELQTIAAHNLPIVITIFNNGGYASIRQSQRNFFDREFGAGPESGVSLPDFVSVASAFGIPAHRICGLDFSSRLKEVMNGDGPMLLDVMLDPEQNFEPKVSSRRNSAGILVSSRIEDMAPFLPPEELDRHLLRARHE